MDLKGTIKNIIGEQLLSDIKGQVMHYVLSTELAAKKQSKIIIDENQFHVTYHLEDKHYHVFRGYYDLTYMSNDREIFLAHRLSLKARNNRDTKVEIGFYDLKTMRFHKIAESYAWCWQQGSRLRFHPLETHKVMYNDVDGGDYCTRIVNIRTGEREIINFPLYDVSPDFKWGISLNYSRLQRKRPGYGYNYFPDFTEGVNAPDNDGIFLVDTVNNKKELMYPIKELMFTADLPESNEYYINHISISPDGSKFIFFLIYTKPGVKGWWTVLFVSDAELHVLEKTDRVSHYRWIDSQNIMVTCHKDNGEEYYCVYDVVTGEKKILNIQGLTVDGHPGILNGRYITDTYPLDKSLQKIRLFKSNDKSVKTVASFYHDFRLRGEKRCDLHPAVEIDGEYVSIDTTYNAGKRSILILKNIGDN